MAAAATLTKLGDAHGQEYSAWQEGPFWKSLYTCELSGTYTAGNITIDPTTLGVGVPVSLFSLQPITTGTYSLNLSYNTTTGVVTLTDLATGAELASNTAITGTNPVVAYGTGNSV